MGNASVTITVPHIIYQNLHIAQKAIHISLHFRISGTFQINQFIFQISINAFNKLRSKP